MRALWEIDFNVKYAPSLNIVKEILYCTFRMRPHIDLSNIHVRRRNVVLISSGVHLHYQYLYKRYTYVPEVLDVPIMY